MIIESSGIEQLAIDVAFEPSISGKFIEKEYRIFTRYYLGFDKYGDSILPLIDYFYKTTRSVAIKEKRPSAQRYIFRVPANWQEFRI